MADTPLPGYPQPMGSRMIAILNHAGPKANAYTAGGEVFDATHLFGGGVLDAVLPGVSWSYNASAVGTYYVIVVYPVAQAIAGASGPLTVKLQWFTAAGSEVTTQDLSAEFVKLVVIGG